MSPRRTTVSRSGEQIAHTILRLATRGMPRVDFLSNVCRLLIEHTACDHVEIWMHEEDDCARCTLSSRGAETFNFELLPCPEASARPRPRRQRRSDFPEQTCARQLAQRFAQSHGVGLVVGGEHVGWLGVGAHAPTRCASDLVDRLEIVSRTLGIALINQRAHAALRERVKELTGLYKLSQLAEDPDISRDVLLQGIAELLPPAWQYPEITVGRVVFDDREFLSADTADQPVASQQTPIVIDHVVRGLVEVGYTASKPILDEGPFLKEERNLLNAIAREIASIVERRTAAEERARLQGQLLHADRLATIGQLAAGVAHELNEPLGAILGFAQLVSTSPELPAAAATDLAKIESAALHAREIVRKLMLFARQMPPNTTRVNLNRTVEDGLYFLESRCARKGIQLRTELDRELPRITADPSQLHQVLVNLVVNAVQAMPRGGSLLITTSSGDDSVKLEVRDTGVGMSTEVLAQAFLPFFTTKDVNQGTGLGLAVVHGIVTAHGGTIHLDSEEGVGTTVSIVLPFTQTGAKG